MAHTHKHSHIWFSQAVLVIKNLPANSGDAGKTDSIVWSGRSSGVGNDNPLQYFCQDKSMDKAAWWFTVHWLTKSQTQLSKWVHMHKHTHSLTYIKMICKLQTQNHFLCNCKLKLSLHLSEIIYSYLYIYIYLFIFITVICCVH